MNKIISIVSAVAIFFLSMGNAFAKTALTVYTAIEAEDLKRYAHFANLYRHYICAVVSL